MRRREHDSPGALALVVAVLAGSSCFHDDPPQLGCAETSACDSTTTTTGETTSSSTTSTTTTTTGAPPLEPRTFRIDSLSLVDPHLFSDLCVDVAGLVNSFGLKQQIEDGELNLVLHFDAFDPDDLAAVLAEASACDLAAGTCVLEDDISLLLPVERITEPPCLGLDPAVLSSKSAAALYSPQPTCFRTGAVELALPLGAADAPLFMLQTQVAFNFDDPDDPAAVQRGVISGFLPRASAEEVDIEVSGASYNLWAMIRGPDGCAEKFPDLLPSVDELADEDGPIEGVWLAFNTTASRIALVSP